MEFKKGDIVVCKKPYKSSLHGWYHGPEEYLTVGSEYKLIEYNDSYFYIQDRHDTYSFHILTFKEHFYTKKQLRKLKLDEIKLA